MSDCIDDRPSAESAGFPPGTLLIPKDGIESAERPDGTWDVTISMVHASPEDIEFIKARDMTLDEVTRMFALPPSLVGSP
jgi:hypothetical protein